MVISTESVSSRGERGIQELPSPNSRVLLRLGVRAFSARQNPSVPDLLKLESDFESVKKRDAQLSGLTLQAGGTGSIPVKSTNHLSSLDGSASFGFTINAGITGNTLTGTASGATFSAVVARNGKSVSQGTMDPGLVCIEFATGNASGAGTTHLRSASFLQAP